MRRLKLSLSWLIVALGCLVGFLVCVGLGFAQVSSLSSPAPHLAWSGVAGMALLGLALLTSSLVAVGNRKTAGFILLAAIPVAAACLAYSTSDDGMWLPPLAGWSVAFLLPGLFWVLTEKRGWPSLVQDRPRSLKTRVSAVAATCVAVLCLDIILTVILSGLGSSLFSGTCGGPPPYRRAGSPAHAVFTARVIFAARSIEARGAMNSLRPTRPDGDVGDWAIGVVQEDFWGMPRWTRVVLLKNNVYRKGETYFVDGRRAGGLLTQLLPIVEGGVGCSRTRPVQYAAVDLRLLRRPSPRGATRVTGVVRGPETYIPGLVRPRTPAFVSGARIDIVGSTWASTIATDAAGVYEVDGLPPGDYTLRLSAPETQAVGFFRDDGSPARIHLDPGGLVERNFELFWDGRIEGKVYDASGAPARAWVQLIRADGRQLPAFVHHFEQTADDGSYRFHKIPRGRYLVVVNPGGPGDGWPHDIQYYPGTDRKAQAHVFDLGDGERVSGVDVRAPRLTKRVLRARVIRADGTLVPARRSAWPTTRPMKRFAFDGDEPPGRRYVSQPMQSGADQIPDVTSFVLNSAHGQ